MSLNLGLARYNVKPSRKSASMLRAGCLNPVQEMRSLSGLAAVGATEETEEIILGREQHLRVR
jgi:hypothetical protein